MPKLPMCFEETLLGEPKGGLRQYRGPLGTHVHEFNDTWLFHRDKIDPRFDAIGHFISDAPHILVLGALIALPILGSIFAEEDDHTET